jgi:hypothetical protein
MGNLETEGSNHSSFTGANRFLKELWSRKCEKTVCKGFSLYSLLDEGGSLEKDV